MKKSTKKQEGITLIALVVTIIVLIILAGVSISMIIGDNGIITLSQNAKKETEITDVKEKLQMEVLDKQVKNKGNIKKVEFIEILGKYFKDVPTEENLPEDLTTLILQTKEEYGLYEINIGEIWNGTFNIEIGENFAEIVTSTNYGDFVDYPIDLNEDGDTTNDWRIFYNNGTNVFMIAADYVKNNSIYLDNAGTGMTIDDTYKLYWNSVPNVQTVEANILSLFKQSWTDYSTNENGRCVSTLLNTNNWDGFVNTSYASYAIGGPTIEMWVASYNAKGDTVLYTNKNITGYYIGNTEGTTDYSYNLSDDARYDDTLYFSHQEGFNNCTGYWIASPSDIDPNQLMRVHYSGDVGNYSYKGTYVGIRPVVSLKADITAMKDVKGIWKIQE